MNPMQNWKRPNTTDAQIARIIELKAEGEMTLYQIANEVDLPYATVNNVWFRHRKQQAAK